LGVTKDEMAGSHATMVLGLSGGEIPQVDPQLAMRLFHAVHAAIQSGLIRSCHDLSEGGLAVSLAEMAFAGGLGIDIDVSTAAELMFVNVATLLFSESNSRFVCEVTPENAAAFEKVFQDIACTKLGVVTPEDRVVMRSGPKALVDLPWSHLKQTWLAPLDWE
jgi:phosphoribosylformylglycinamidine synthase